MSKSIELRKHVRNNSELAYPHGSPIFYLIKKLEEGKIDQIRADSNDDLFQLCAEICFPCMIPKQTWKNNHQHIAISKLITVADEALSLVVLENNYLEWIELAKGNEINKRDRKTKYTHGGVNKDGTKKGWSLEGKNRFNAMFDEALVEREKSESKEREARIKAIWYDKRPSEHQQAVDTEDEGNTAKTQEEQYVPRTDFDFE